MKTFFKCLFTLILLFVGVGNFNVIKADDNFDTFVNTEYKVIETGSTLVTHTITIKNKKSDFFVKKYIFTLSGVAPKNIKTYETGSLLKTSLEESGNISKITVDFNEKSVGKDNTKTFLITYDTDKLSKKSGEIWEVSIPKLTNPESYDEYKVVLNVPSIFGDEAFISPEPISSSKKDDRTYYNFTKDKIFKSGVTAGFGKFQVFNFELKYHLENLEDKENFFDIALPPDTSIQRMFYEKISPEPENVKIDSDGNWIASFKIPEKQKLDITTFGKVQIFASPRTFSIGKPNASDLAPTSYWQSDDPEIIQIAKRLETPEDIYNYVSENLKYNFEKFGQNNERKGAKAALSDPSDSLCTEFTDLFIALARAKGIPAREINGFAYSLNPQVEPLSLVADILHAWPEYWDESRKTWVPVDPTWASTTGGVDFFNKFDLRHFAFVVHGENPVLPYSAGSYKVGNPQKDVLVTFGSLPSIKDPTIAMNYKYEDGFPIFKGNILVSTENKGPTAAYDLNYSILFDGVVSSKQEIEVILPFEKYSNHFSIPYGVLGTKSPKSVKVVSEYSEIDILMRQSLVILNQLLIFSCFLLLIMILIAIKFKGKISKYIFYAYDTVFKNSN